MSVLSVDPKAGTTITASVLDEVCNGLGVQIRDEEKEDYTKLLAVFDEGCQELMAMDDYIPAVDLVRFPRTQVYQPDNKKNNKNKNKNDSSENAFNAWAWRCSIKDTQPNNGILAGKTIALKDMIAVKDVPMQLGTEFVQGHVPNLDATVTTRVLEAGGHILGKAVCENLCHSATSHSAASGAVENPHATGYSCGGSSSGSGALVASGQVDLSIGADQGGSVRIPATNCGIVGLKPTFGLIPYTGCASNEATNDHLGPMSRSILDNAMLLQAIAGSDNIDDRSFAAPSPLAIPRYYQNLLKWALPDPDPDADTNGQGEKEAKNKSLSGIKIGIISESVNNNSSGKKNCPLLDPRVQQCFLHAAEKFRALGAEVSEVSIPMHSQGPIIWTAISKPGGHLSKMHNYHGRRGHMMHELQGQFSAAWQSPERWKQALYVSSKNIHLNGAYAAAAYPALHAKATNLSRKLRDAYDRALQDYDVLLTPTLPYVATSHCEPGATPLEQIKKQVGLVSNTCPFNQSGHPALAMPIGTLPPLEGPAAGNEQVKLPVGMQIVGKWWAEETVYRVGYAWELANDWKQMS